MREVGIQGVFQAVKDGDLEKISQVCEADLPDLPYEELNFQDAKSLNGNKPIYDALVGYYQACDESCRKKMVHQLNLLIRRCLRATFPEKGGEIDVIYVGMLIPYQPVEVVDRKAFSETWDDFVGNSLPV